MGCKNSVVEPNQNEGSDSFEAPGSRRGGGGIIRSIKKSFSESVSVEWKVVIPNNEARKLYEEDGTLEKSCPESYVELRMMLDDHVSRAVLGKYAIQTKQSAPLMCWMDIQEFKEIFAENYRYAKALDIYHTFVKADCTFQLDFLQYQDIEKIKGDLDYIEHDLYLLTTSFYNGLQSRCFNFMHDSIYAGFKETEEFFALARRLDKKYNKVKVNDFVYFNGLGEGGFGYVAHCMKKSTGIHYAVKIQRKLDLIKSAGKHPSRVCLEKKAFAVCQHPFIINLAYAFQTEKLVFMVLELSLAGDLQQLLGKCQNNKIDEEHVRFFMAEVALAISYLHQTGYIYRDLKPSNILLEEGGHVKLVDLGGCADLKDTATHAVTKRIPLQPQPTTVIAAETEEIAPSGENVATYYQRLGGQDSAKAKDGSKSLDGKDNPKSAKVKGHESPHNSQLSEEEPHRFDVFGTLM
jgi:hypothetical protein